MLFKPVRRTRSWSPQSKVSSGLRVKGFDHALPRASEPAESDHVLHEATLIEDQKSLDDNDVPDPK